MDEDYQRKRQEAINRRPQNFTEGMARGVDNLTQGVVQGKQFWRLFFEKS